MYACLCMYVIFTFSIWSSMNLGDVITNREFSHSHIWNINIWFARVRIAFPLTAIHYNPWNADTLLFRKADKFFSPFSTWTVHNSLDNVDVHLPLMQVCPPQLIDSTTGYYNNIGSHSSSLWSAFLASVQQGRTLERTFVALNSMGVHCHAYQKYTRSLRNTNASFIWTRSNSPMVSAIEGFHCSIKRLQLKTAKYIT